MIAAYLDLVTRIQQELADLERVVARADRAMSAMTKDVLAMPPERVGKRPQVVIGRPDEWAFSKS